MGGNGRAFRWSSSCCYSTALGTTETPRHATTFQPYHTPRPYHTSAYLSVASLVFLLTGVPHTLTGDGSAVSKPLPIATAVFAAVLVR